MHGNYQKSTSSQEGTRNRQTGIDAKDCTSVYLEHLMSFVPKPAKNNFLSFFRVDFAFEQKKRLFFNTCKKVIPTYTNAVVITQEKLLVKLIQYNKILSPLVINALSSIRLGQRNSFNIMKFYIFCNARDLRVFVGSEK